MSDPTDPATGSLPTLSPEGTGGTEGKPAPLERTDPSRDKDAVFEALTRKLSGFFTPSDAITEELLRLCSEVRMFAAKERIVAAGKPYSGIYLIKSGWAVRSRMLENGSRQIVNVAMAGDLLCLNALIFDSSDFDVVAQTRTVMFVLQVDRLRALLGRDPTLAAALFWVTAHEESILAERIVSLGRRNARTRTAHVLCEILARLEIIAPETGARTADNILIPLTQEDFADILGTSLVHTNKTLRALERDGILTFRQGLLRVDDRPRLEATAGFDRGYLHFTRTRSKRRTTRSG